MGKIKKKLQSLGLGRKILLSNLVLFVVPCLILMLLLFNLVQTGANERLNSSKMVILNQIDQNMEDMFQDIISYTNYFYCNRELNRLISLRDFPAPYDEIVTQKHIRSYFRESRIIYSNMDYNMRLLCDNGKNYSTEDDGSENLVYPRLEQLMQEDWYQQLGENTSSIKYIPAYVSEEFQKTEDGSAMRAVRLTKNLNSGRVLGIMEVNIQQKQMKDIFRGGLEKESQQVFLMDGTGRILCSTEDSLTQQRVEEKEYLSKMTGYDHGYFSAGMNGRPAQVSFVTNETTGWKLVMYEEEKGAVWAGNRIFVMILLVAAVYVLLAVFMSVYNSRYISGPLQKLKADMKNVYRGDLTVRTPVETTDEFGQLSLQFNQMLERIEELIVRLEQEEEEKRSLEMQALQAQINPHFLYNTLASIRFLVEMDMGDRADQSLLALVKLLRRTYSDKRELIPVAEEMESLKNYLVLMENRYQDTFVWNLEVSAEAGDCLIPRISVQPLVENAIAHGFCQKEDTGHILIEARAEGGILLVRVEDDGIGGNLEYIREVLAGKEETHTKEQFSGIGIRNVQKRLQIIYGEEYGISAEHTSGGGMRFDIRIPHKAVQKGVRTTGQEEMRDIRCGL